jgi:hypothetical protein
MEIFNYILSNTGLFTKKDKCLAKTLSLSLAWLQIQSAGKYIAGKYNQAICGKCKRRVVMT